jgi:putative Ca2+/H+ antiporter (TMEM165/GDT1 family)
MAVWIVIPDRIDASRTQVERFGVLGTTIVAFFLAEMGDKTQIATVALAAKYAAVAAVVAGTTLGMMAANVPAVMLGDRLAGKIPLRLARAVAAGIFAVLGLLLALGDFS